MLVNLIEFVIVTRFELAILLRMVFEKEFEKELVFE